ERADRGPVPTRGVPVPARSVSPPSRRRSGFWDGSIVAVVVILAGLLVPLGFILNQRSYVGAANEEAFGLATAVMAFALAGMVHLLEGVLFRRSSTKAA